MRRRAIVVGSGAGGSMCARELARAGLEVTVLEAGGPFRPLSLDLSRLEWARRAGLFLDARMIGPLFPAMRVNLGEVGLVHVRGTGIGGTTTLATGNAARYDRHLQAIGIDLTPEFEELAREVPTTTGHRRGWSELTERIFDSFERLGFAPVVTPKFMEDPGRCVACGRCVLGCRHGAKWTADELIRDTEHITLLPHARVERVIVGEGGATGVRYRHGMRAEEMRADLVVLAAGGLSTPSVLEASGIPTERTLFVDPVLCVAARVPGANLDRQLPMPFVAERDGYILSPYFDWLSFYFNRAWRMPSADIMSLMVKMADDSLGSFDGRTLDKPLTDADWETIARAIDECHLVFEDMGVRREDTFPGTLNAGHPGGCLPLTEAEAESLHHEVLPGNLYVADATVLPRSLGFPPTLTIMALAKRVARLAAGA